MGGAAVAGGGGEGGGRGEAGGGRNVTERSKYIRQPASGIRIRMHSPEPLKPRHSHGPVKGGSACLGYLSNLVLNQKAIGWVLPYWVTISYF